MTQQFPLLFTPFKLGKYTLQSRIVVTGHQANMIEARMPNESYGYYLRERAKGGAGMVMIGSCYVHRTGFVAHENIDDAIIPRYQRIADLVHEYPVPVITQMNHNGRRAAMTQRTVLNGDLMALAPSAVPMPGFGYEQAMPKEMNIGEIEELIAAYGSAAERVRKGGLDGVEILIGAYNLIAQFLHGHSNRRTDRYGGETLEERAAFMMEVLQAVRNGLGPDLLLGGAPVRRPGQLQHRFRRRQVHCADAGRIRAAGLPQRVDRQHGERGVQPLPRAAPLYPAGGVCLARRGNEEAGQPAGAGSRPHQHAGLGRGDTGLREDGPGGKWSGR